MMAFRIRNYLLLCDFTMGIRLWLRKAFFRRITDSKSYMKRAVDTTLEQAFHSSMFSLVMLTLVWIAIFSYVLFYYAYIPASSYVRPVHLQIERCAEYQKGCMFPSAHVRLTRKHQLLMNGQQYKFFIQLEMPESPTNKQLGMFMVCIRLKDKNGYLTSQSCRSNMLHYRSDILEKIKIVLLSPFYILGGKEEKQTVTFELYSDFHEDHRHPVTDIYVEVQAQSIEIYSATLQINAHLVGLRYIMYQWQITSAIIGIIFNLCVILFILSLSFYHNFFVDSAPVQTIRTCLRDLDLETKTDQLLKNISLISGDSSTEETGGVSTFHAEVSMASTSGLIQEPSELLS